MFATALSEVVGYFLPAWNTTRQGENLAEETSSRRDPFTHPVPSQLSAGDTW